MNRSDYTDYFLYPEQAIHRRHEVLRAVFVERESLQDVARRFDLTYGSIRNWTNDFCRSRDAGEAPPFSFHPIAAVPHRTRAMT